MFYDADEAARYVEWLFVMSSGVSDDELDHPTEVSALACVIDVEVSARWNSTDPPTKTQAREKLSQLRRDQVSPADQELTGWVYAYMHMFLDDVGRATGLRIFSEETPSVGTAAHVVVAEMKRGSYDEAQMALVAAHEALPAYHWLKKLFPRRTGETSWGRLDPGEPCNCHQSLALAAMLQEVADKFILRSSDDYARVQALLSEVVR